MAGDASYPNTSVLLLGNGANNSTNIIDSGYPGLVWTPNGNAKISTAQYPFGGSSLYFDGNGDWIDTPANVALNMGSGNFAIEAMVRFDAAGTRQVILSQANSTAQNSSLSFHIEKTAANKIQAFCCSGSSVVGDITGGTSLSAAVWYYLAYIRNGNNFNLYLDAVSDASTVTSSATINSSSNKLSIGRLGEYASGLNMAGYVKCVRITKGYVRTPLVPTADYMAWAGQVSGVVRDSAGAFAARTVRAHRRDTGALVASTTSDAGTGAYTLNCPTLDEVYRIIMDSATSGTIYDDLIDRVIPA